MIMKTRQQHNNAPRPLFRSMRKAATTLVGSLAAVAALTLAACSDDDITANTTPVVLPASLEMNIPEELQRLVYTDNTGSECLPLIKGETVQIPITLQPDTATFTDVEWSSNNEAVATVDQEGNITAISGDGTGSSTISVMPLGFLAASGVSASIKVVVSNELVQAQSMEIYTTASELYAGDTLHLTPVIAPDNSTYKTVEWSSSDENLATVSADGVLTAQVSDAVLAPVTITATALDGSGVTATKTINIRQIVQPEEVSIDQVFSVDNGYLCAINEKTLKLNYTTVPAECTTSLIEWTSSNEAIATVDNGVVTFNQNGVFGDVTITATCPATGQSSSIKLNLAAGLVRELFKNENNVTWGATGHCTVTYNYDEGYMTVTANTASAKQRADFKTLSPKTWLHAGEYPIIAIRMENVNDRDDVSKVNINLDTSGNCEGTKFSGNFGGSNNKWAHDYKCNDGSHVYIYDLSTQTFPTGGALPTTSVAEFTTFQVKYADIETTTTDENLSFKVYSIQTFKTLQDVFDYIEGEGLTYEIIK